MTSSEGPGEPSMEDILASIRKIIAEEPIGTRPLPEPRLKTVSALAEKRAEAAQPERPAAGHGRLADAIRTSAPAPARPQVRPVAASIDEDLADLLGGSTLAARDVPPTPRPSEKIEGLQPAVAWKGPSPGAQPAQALSGLSPARSEPGPGPAEPTPATVPFGSFLADTGKPLDIGTIVPGLMSLADPPPAPFSAPARSEAREPSLTSEPAKPAIDAERVREKSPLAAAAEAAQAIAAERETKKAGPELIAAMPLISPAPSAAPPERDGSAPKVDLSPTTPSRLKPAEITASTEAASAAKAAAPGPALNLDTSAAAASALGALAAGLAATRAKADAAKGDVTTAPSPPPAAKNDDAKNDDAKVEVTPLPELPTSVCSVPDFFIHGVTQRNPKPAAPADFGLPSGSLRSLEDTVAELLRPMLRQWLADNMPRIVEKALRIEVAESLKPGAKRPTG